MSRKQTKHEQLAHLGEDQLFHIARNESALYDYRVLAVEILRERNSVKASHPEVANLKQRGDYEDIGVYPLPEIAHESEIHPVDHGPLKASVTTQTMFGVQKMDTDVPPADEAPISSTIDNEKE